MGKTNFLSDLLMKELAELLDAENQLIEALPTMMAQSQSLALKLILEAHREVTQGHASRLQDIFSSIPQVPQRVVCKNVKGFIEEGGFDVNETEKSPARDAAIINVAQRVEQYGIAAYQTAYEHGVELNHTVIVDLLTKTLDEKRLMYLHLNELAQGMINAQAIGFPFYQRRES